MTIVFAATGVEHSTFTFSDVTHLRVEETGLILEASLRLLPQNGPWPEEARHLLHLHNNAAELVWLKLGGPAELEIVAHSLAVKAHR